MVRADLQDLASSGSLSAIETANGVFPVGQAIAVLVRGAWAPFGNRELNRKIVNAVNGQQLMAGGKFDASLAVREINKALQIAYSYIPGGAAYTNTVLGLAKAISEKNQVLLQNPSD